jgi:N-acetylmuramate 1-kinase
MTQAQMALWLEDFIAGNPYELQLLAASGSDRQNYVLHLNQKKYIVTHNKHVAENEAFFYWTQQFQAQNLPVTQLLKISDDKQTYVQTYLGDQTLAEYMAQHGHSPQTKNYLLQSVKTLVEVQKAMANHQDYSQTFEYQSYNRWAVYNDLFYFKNYFVDYLEIHYKKAQLIAEFEQIALGVEQLASGLMLRDYQSRNIMVDGVGGVALIDYQSTMRGPLCYDVVSLLCQAKANYPQDWQAEMWQYFAQAWEANYSLAELEHNFKTCQLLRFTQVLGAYGFRGLVQGKAHFISSIPQGVANLQNLAQSWEGLAQYPELKRLILSLDLQKIQTKIS